MTDAVNEHVFVSLILTGMVRPHLPRTEDGQMVLLTASQARALATSLITAVNRAEVKASLR